jgi:molybdopterin-guanine dinucleotide biosynthesis protein B
MRGSGGSAVVVGVVGRSGAGKTSLLARLIPVLAARGLAVGAVKHASHGFLADRPGKDSYRIYEAGAEAVALVSREQIATFVRRDDRTRGEVSLLAALAALPRGLDLVLVEGFSWEPIPRIVLVPGREAPAPEHLVPGEVLDLVRVPAPPPGGPPVFPDRPIAALAEGIASRVRPREEGPCWSATSPTPS